MPISEMTNKATETGALVKLPFIGKASVIFIIQVRHHVYIVKYNMKTSINLYVLISLVQINRITANPVDIFQIAEAVFNCTIPLDYYVVT